MFYFILISYNLLIIYNIIIYAITQPPSTLFPKWYNYHFFGDKIIFPN